jgi:hypothetical protein
MQERQSVWSKTPEVFRASMDRVNKAGGKYRNAAWPQNPMALTYGLIGIRPQRALELDQKARSQSWSLEN